MNLTNQSPLKLNVENLFMCPVYRANDPSWLYLDKASDRIVLKSIEAHKERRKEDKTKPKIPNSYHSENLWQHSEFKPFAGFVMQQMWNILSNQGYNLEAKQPLLTECWVQEFPIEGGFHDIHIHGNNHMSGFYFLKCSNKTSKPFFHDPRPGKLMTDLTNREPKKVNYSNSMINYPVRPGEFIFFNSYMPHSYQHHKGKERFRFIHFNMQAATLNNIEGLGKK